MDRIWDIQLYSHNYFWHNFDRCIARSTRYQSSAASFGMRFEIDNQRKGNFKHCSFCGNYLFISLLGISCRYKRTKACHSTDISDCILHERLLVAHRQLLHSCISAIFEWVLVSILLFVWQSLHEQNYSSAPVYSNIGGNVLSSC